MSTSPTTNLRRANFPVAMSCHRFYHLVQLLGCEPIRVATTGATSVARLAAKELFTAGTATAVAAALSRHPTDASIVDRDVVAFRSLLHGGGFDGGAVEPGLHVDAYFAELVTFVVDRMSAFCLSQGQQSWQCCHCLCYGCSYSHRF